MTLKAKLGIVGGIALVALIAIGFVMDISYQNTYERLGQDITAEYKKRESKYEAVSRIILQQAGILNKYSTDFKDIVKGLMGAGGRYGSDGKDGSKAMWQWIKEQNPQIDIGIYTKLMTTVEAQRTAFDRQQKKIAAMVAESNKLLTTRPAKWFVNGEMKEVTIVSSSATKAIMESGIDDTSNDLFGGDKK